MLLTESQNEMPILSVLIPMRCNRSSLFDSEIMSRAQQHSRPHLSMSMTWTFIPRLASVTCRHGRIQKIGAARAVARGSCFALYNG